MLRSMCRVAERKGLDLIQMYRVWSFIVCLECQLSRGYVDGMETYYMIKLNGRGNYERTSCIYSFVTYVMTLLVI